MSRPRGEASTQPDESIRSLSAAPAGLFAIDELVGGIYQVRAVLGEGGMGIVFEAHDTVLNRRVALKASFAHVDGALLLNEARALAAIHHRSLASVYGFGEHRGIRYAVIERIYGTTLADHLERREETEGAPPKLSMREVIDIVLPIAEVLGVVHRAGLAHRDVKPSNIMLSPGDRVVLMDFGLFLPESQAADALVSGTPRYIAPETVTGTVEGRTAFQVDMYALGILTFELLTGNTPFQGESPIETMKLHVTGDAPKLRSVRADIPAALAELVDQMIAKDPHDRPPGMDAVVWRLKQLVQAHTHSAKSSAAGDSFFVVIVEDEDAIARMLEMYVKKAAPSAEVARARTADDAMHLVAKKIPHMMLLDLHMPKMTGVELGMYLRGAHVVDSCRIVAMSAAASEADVELLRQIGITDFVDKSAPKLGERIAAQVKAVAEAFRRYSRPPSM